MADPTLTRERPELPDRVTMPLLALVAQGAVDEDYVHAARRRVDAGRPVALGGRHGVAAAVIVAFGLLIAVAAVQTSRNADVDSASRAALIERIDARKDGLAGQKGQIRALGKENSELAQTRRRLDATIGDAQARLTDLRVATGFVSVHGPGVQLTVDDNPDGDSDGRVRASDLRLLVNGLWEAGADAITINGRRLTTLSSIVNANISVQVNRAPTSPPYVVAAIGAGTMLARLADTTGGVTFQAIAQEFGFEVDRQNVTDLTMLPAPPGQLPLRFAKPAGKGPGNQEETTP